MSFTNFANAIGTNIQKFHTVTAQVAWGRKSYLMRIEILEEPGTGQFIISNAAGNVIQFDANVPADLSIAANQTFVRDQVQRMRDFLRTGKV